MDIMVDMRTSKKKAILHLNEIYNNLEEHLPRALTICHVFTGNDYNPAFFRKGKKHFVIKKNN